jgi:transcription termination factor NusB
MIEGYNDKNNVVFNFFLQNGMIKDDTISLSNHSSPFPPATQSMKKTKSYNVVFLCFGVIIFILSIFGIGYGVTKLIKFGGFDEKKLIKVANSITIYSYLWVFKLYEMRICTDIEQLKIDYDDCNLGNSNTDYYVPTYKRLYILFDKLIEDYEKDEKDEIYIGLLEKYLFENDYELYYRIQEIKRCVLGDSNYNIDFAEFDKFKELEIYTKTYDYFNEALKDVNTKNEKIQNNIVKYYENNAVPIELPNKISKPSENMVTFCDSSITSTNEAGYGNK